MGAVLRDEIGGLTQTSAVAGAVKGRGLFVGLSFIDPDDPARANPSGARAVVEDMVAKDTLISRTGRSDNVLKIRPPLVFDDEHAELLLDRLASVLRDGDSNA